ncbi:MAG: DNA invertase, partial [Lachnospiraceae bacterium]|nr:DNA invertase [Lachnospiraceae bacterium]
DVYKRQAREQLRNARAKIDTKMRNVQRDIAAANNAEQTSYMQYRAGVICQGAYNESKVRQQGRLRDLDRQRAALEADREKLDAISGKHLAAVRALLRLKSGGELTKELVESLIRRIEVYPGKRIEVWFCYSNELLEGVLKNG